MTSIFPTPDKDIKLIRVTLLPGGHSRTSLMPICACNEQRGPKGGVCGHCNGAIPSDEEKLERLPR